MGMEVPFSFSARDVPAPLQGQGEDFEACPPSQACHKIYFDGEEKGHHIYGYYIVSTNQRSYLSGGQSHLRRITGIWES